MASAPQAIFPVHREFITEAIIVRAIGHPLRLKILSEILHQQCNVTKICLSLEVSQAVVSHHLAVLKDAGIVIGSRKGAEVFYSIEIPFIKSLLLVLTT
jgi:ArsR family transcriptional regulator